MNIKLENNELELAVKEYIYRRGIPTDVLLDVEFRAGRKGNPSSAKVTISEAVTNEVAPAEQVYAGEVGTQEPETPELPGEVQEEQIMTVQEPVEEAADVPAQTQTIQPSADAVEESQTIDSAQADADLGEGSSMMPKSPLVEDEPQRKLFG